MTNLGNKIDPGDSEEFKTFSILETILLGGISPTPVKGRRPPIIPTKKEEVILSKLLRGGYIEPDNRGVEELILDLPEGQIKSVLSTYERVANEKGVTEEELDELLNAQLRKWGYRKPPSKEEIEKDYRDERPYFADLLRSIVSARSKTDKVLALDRLVATAHGSGPQVIDFKYLASAGWEGLGWSSRYRRLMEVEGVSMKVVNKLSE